jgi:hypothetical protein
MRRGNYDRFAIAIPALVLAAIVAWFSATVRADEPAANTADGIEQRTKRIRVVNQNGEPVVGATVIPWAVRSQRGHGMWRSGPKLDQEPPEITTDNEGRGQFSFPAFIDEDRKFPPMLFTCSVAHPEYAGSTYNDVQVENEAYKEESTIDVRTGAAIEITPFADRVNVNPAQVYAAWSASAPNRERNKVNERGAIELPHLPAGKELLQIVYLPDDGAVMYSDVKKIELHDGDHHQLRLELKPAVRVEGRLEGPVERPVKEGRVIGEVILWDEEVQGTLQWRSAATMRIDGSFVFESLPRGDLQVIATCPGAMADDGETPTFARDHEKQQGATFFCRPQVFKLQDETTRVVVKMVKTADCLVHVVGPDNAAVAGAKCGFWPNVGWWRGGSQVYGRPFYSTIDLLKDPSLRELFRRPDYAYSAETDAEGQALIKNLPAKANQLGVYHDTLQMPGNDPHPSQMVSLAAGQQVEVSVKLQAKK